MLRLTLVRHASTALNDQRRYQGWIDPPLSRRGRLEAARLGDRLRARHFDLVTCSDSRRCTETAEIALPRRTPRTDHRLRELHFGAWDGLTYDECQVRDGEQLQAWIADPTQVSPPQGERFDTFCQRVDEAIDALPAEGEILLIAHGGTIRRILARAIGLELHHAMLMELTPCGITRLALHPAGGHLLGHNDTAHLEG